MNAICQAPPELVGTRSGIALSIRPATQADEDLLKVFYELVSEADRRFRFLSAQPHVGHEQIAQMLQTDHFRTETFLAIRADTGELVATGMLACDKPLECAEVAVSVRADHRGKGVGWAMLDLLAAEACRRGVREVIAIEDRDNHAAIELEREKGFVPRAFEGDPHLVVLAKHFGS